MQSNSSNIMLYNVKKKKNYIAYIDELSVNMHIKLVSEGRKHSPSSREEQSCADTTNQTGYQTTVKLAEHDGAQRYTTYSIFQTAKQIASKTLLTPTSRPTNRQT